MRTRRSSFPKSELLILFLLTVPLASIGCGPRTVWGLPVEELKARLAKADYAALASLDMKGQDLDQALELGPAGPYCLSHIFDGLNRPDAARGLLELAWTKSPEPWKTRAGLELARLEVSDKSLDAAAGTARALIGATAGTGDEAVARRLLVEALYWKQDDEAVLRESAGLPPGDAEVELFRAVSSLRLGRENARSLFFSLFLNRRASVIHSRAYLYLTSDAAWWGIFTDTEKKMFEAVYCLAERNWGKGIPLMEEAASRLSLPQLAGGPVLPELGAAYVDAGMAARGYAFLEKLSRGLSGDAKLDALEAAGKCARKIPDNAKSLSCFRAVAAGASDPERQERARWYVLEALVAMKPSDLMGRIGREVPGWKDPGYYADLLETAVSEAVADRRWSDLMALDAALGDRSPGPVKAQLSYILGRLLSEKIVKRVPGRPDKTPQDLFTRARDADPEGYYGTLAACVLGRTPALGAPRAAQENGAGTDAQAQMQSDPFIDGLLSFGLTEDAYESIRSKRALLNEEAILSYAGAMGEAGNFRRSMNLMAWIDSRRALSAEELRMLYPRAFAALIEQLASANGLQAPFLYATIREESYFDPRIVSGAGAVGLAQLMPATAADAARRLKMQAPDLTDPQTSLTLGMNHFMVLLDRLGSLPMVLLAYNAGLSRARSWDRVNGGLELDLFVESVPYPESREYVRKIMLSTIMYAGIYGGMSPVQAVELFYPDLVPAGP